MRTIALDVFDRSFDGQNCWRLAPAVVATRLHF